MPDLVEVQETYKSRRFTVIAVTDASKADAERFAEEFSVNFPVVYDAAIDLQNFGVRMIWGSTYYLVGPDRTVVASGLDQCQRVLSDRSDP